MDNKFRAKILLAEDDENLGVLLQEYLKVKGFNTDLFQDGEKALEGFQNGLTSPYDVCILDVMMPKKDGYTLAKEIRQLNPIVPILFLTAKSMKEDVVEGFSSGADDYITKPFNIEELIMRIEAILRRTSAGDIIKDSITLGKFVFNPIKQTLIFTPRDEEVKLTSKESELLKCLCMHKNTVLDRQYALRTIWSDDSYFNARSMDVYITKLRKYLAEDENIQILNVRGRGFKLID